MVAKKKMGRPVKEINWTLFEDLCSIQCTQEEICHVLKIDASTIRIKVEKNYNKTYPVVYKEFSDTGKASLRRYQFKLAQKNTAMCIWLGKQYLGQSENPQTVQIDKAVLDKLDDFMKQMQVMREMQNQAQISVA